MTFGKVLLLLGVVVGTAVLGFLFLAPRLLPANTFAPPPPLAASLPDPTLLPEKASSPPASVDAPRTAAQREFDEIEVRRRPFYERVQQDAGNWLVAAKPLPTDQATLDLYAAQDTATMSEQLLTYAVQPDGYHYGFRRVRFYLPNPPGGVERFHLDAEATADESGTWRLFRR